MIDLLKNYTKIPKNNIIISHLTDTYSLKESKIGNDIDLPGFGRICRLMEILSKNQKEKNILFLHSGDFLFPSFLSNYFKGKQMVDILNHCGLYGCTLGNHDFDGGLEILKKRINESKFKYIVTNLIPPHLISKNILRYDIWSENSTSIAIIGIAGKMTAQKALENGFKIKNLKNSLKETILEIRKKNPEIKLLIVLSHMSDTEDFELKNLLNRIWPFNSIILGGHDHKKVISYNSKSDRCLLVKGKSNARTAQMIILSKKIINQTNQNLKKNLIFLGPKNYQKITPSRKTNEKIESWFIKLKNHNQLPSNKIIKKFPKGVVLDGTEESLRKGSTNFGNFVTDCLKNYTDADISLINSGHFRCDRRFLEKLRLSDLYHTFVMEQKGTILVTTLSKKECVLFLKHAYREEGKGKILQLSKGTLDILKNAKNNAKFRVMLISDMILTDEDGFGKILANYRKISIPKLRKLLKKDIITDSNLIAGILKSADKINYDSDIRLKVGTKITLD
ncbi:MAG: bifunctional metallophosphatase/5'-nucleotidase [Nitrosopumilus sp.]|nr:bifunctional metallophosphatase/5'-nucleotidase [Nitrosopumilus sp.]